MSESKLPISVVITAVDNITYKVMAINEKLAKITAPVNQVKGAFGALGEELGLHKLGHSLKEVGETGKEFFSAVGESLKKMGELGLEAGIVIFELVHTFGEAGEQVNIYSKRLGLTTDKYQELVFAAKTVGISQDELNGSMTKFSKGIGEAAAGTGEAFIGLNALGISVRDSTGHIRKMDSLLPQVADKLGAIQNQSLRNAIATKIFGREGAKLNELFNEGAHGLQHLGEEAHRVGAVMSPEQIKTAREFEEGLKSVTATVLSVRNAIGAALAPVLSKLGKDLQEYILSHTDDIKKFAEAFATNLPGYVATLIDLFNKVVTVLSPVIWAFNFLSSIFGKANVILGAIVAYIAGPAIAAFISFALAIGSALLPALNFAFIALSLIGEVIVGLATGFAALVSWPILLGAALIAVAIAVWKWWEPIKEGILSIWDKVSGFFGSKTTIDQNVNTSSTGPALGPALDFNKTVDASSRSSENKSINHVQVDFTNLPEGTKVDKKKDEGNFDIYMGWAGAGA